MSDRYITVNCTGCYLRTDVYSGMFDPRMAGQVVRSFITMRDCPIHGVSPVWLDRLLGRNPTGAIDDPESAWTDLGGEA